MRYINGFWVRNPRRRGKGILWRFPARRIAAFLGGCALLLGVLTELLLNRVTPELTQRAAQDYLSARAAQAVTELLAQEAGEARYTRIQRDSSGKINSIQMDSAALNRLKSALIRELGEQLRGPARVWIPAGSFLDAAVFNGRGIPLPLTLSFESSTAVRFESVLTSAGINQSCHRIVMKLSVEMTSQSRKIEAAGSYETDFVVSETVIVGEVPQLITGAQSLGN